MQTPKSSEMTLLWYDYETWGANPQRDRLAQFAAVRTDLDLNPIGAPIDLLCQPALDTLVDADAVAITGLSPLDLSERGLSEWHFAEQIHEHLSLSGTCSVGYNSIRFDDECTRYLLYRNLLDPYAREWKNGNARWDLLDVVRMTHALRPDGIQWPVREDGNPSFKLEHLSAANGLAHAKAHDAVSDVLATIALAKLIKDRQPKLYDYAFSLRSKHRVRQHIDIEGRQPHLHFSGKIPAVEHCMGIEIPLMMHPERTNEVIVIDIRADPSWLLAHDAQTLKAWLYSKAADLPEGATRPPLKTVHLNRSPMIASMALLDASTADRLGVDLPNIRAHQAVVEAHPELRALALAVFTDPDRREPSSDPEHALYAGFIDDHDRNLLNRMASDRIAKDRWLDETHLLHDDRLPPLVTNVLARNFPHALTDAQFAAWQSGRRAVLNDPERGQPLSIAAALERVDARLLDAPDQTALLDTRQYLLQRQAYWFGPDPETTNTAPLGNSASSARSEADQPPTNLNDQMDLF
ncbi:exodeoxyribonuclease I [Reinekea sp.]|jgi:exodeoxyribonuclease-1|uniref:exodeoxyribonuclease I n=1 Tax=Reinekea sp. TaxID=1970455 RepID=UPI002A7F034A|nr:exodeoxyribonuclease I [Reinekea sp.]